MFTPERTSRKDANKIEEDVAVKYCGQQGPEVQATCVNCQVVDMEAECSSGKMSGVVLRCGVPSCAAKVHKAEFGLALEVFKLHHIMWPQAQ